MSDFPTPNICRVALYKSDGTSKSVDLCSISIAESKLASEVVSLMTELIQLVELRKRRERGR